MGSPGIQELTKEQTEKLLKRLPEWRSGICPDGSLAKTFCFVLKEIPKVVIHPDQQRKAPSYVITEWDWTQNLLNCGAITYLNDDPMLKTLSDLFMIFYANEDRMNTTNTLHSLLIRKHASFKVDNIFRPTTLLQQKLVEFKAKNNLEEQWSALLDIWKTFGYLWPRKITVGYNIQLKETYTFRNENESSHLFFNHFNILQDKINPMPDIQPFDLDQFLNDGIVVSRENLAPLHEFLDTDTCQYINRIIDSKFIRVPVHYPIKLYNISTNSYLCWDPVKTEQADVILKGEPLEYLVRSVSADHAELKNVPESQYLWRLTWSPTSTGQLGYANHSNLADSKERQPLYLRGSDNVYIYPACKTISPSYYKNKSKSPIQPEHHWPIQDRMSDEPDLADTYKMALSCCPRRYEFEPPNKSKLRGLRLLSNQSLHYASEKIDWTIKYPNIRLEYPMNSDKHIDINIHECVRRIKSVLVNDKVYIQQIGLLTAFNSDPKQRSPSTSPPQQQASTSQPQNVPKIKNKKSNNKKNVLCIDKDITHKQYTINTFWTIQLADSFDLNRHSNYIYHWPQSDQRYGYPINYHPMLSQDIRNHLPYHLDTETGSSASVTPGDQSTRRSEPLQEIEPPETPNEARTQYLEDLVHAKSTSKVISHIVKKSTLHPFAQLVKPSRNRPSPQPHQLSPPPFAQQQHRAGEQP